MVGPGILGFDYSASSIAARMDREMRLPSVSMSVIFTRTVWPSETTSSGLFTRWSASWEMDEAVHAGDDFSKSAEGHQLHDLGIHHVAHMVLVQEQSPGLVSSVGSPGKSCASPGRRR